jgi:hypothetical protein
VRNHEKAMENVNAAQILREKAERKLQKLPGGNLI